MTKAAKKVRMTGGRKLNGTGTPDSARRASLQNVSRSTQRGHMHTVMTCRFCGKSAYDTHEVVKYGVRHYAHFVCYLDAGKSLDDLHPWKAQSFPFRLLKERGLLNHPKLQEPT